MSHLTGPRFFFFFLVVALILVFVLRNSCISDPPDFQPKDRIRNMPRNVTMVITEAL